MEKGENMAERVVYLGPFNNEKKEDLTNKSIERLKKGEGNKFYYLLPNGELLTEYRRKFINQVEKSFEINLFTFDNIVKDILNNQVYLTINDATKDIIIKESIRNLDSLGKIIYYKDFISMEGFIESLNGIIGEIKRSLVYPDEYLKNSPSTPYYREIGEIYKEYESYLERFDLIDREGSYFKAIEILRNSTSYFKDLDFIIIDEFYDFRPIEIEILKELCKSDINIYINIPFDMKTPLSNVNETIITLEKLGFKLENIEKEENNLFETIGEGLFSNEVEKLDYTKDLRLIKAPSVYLELKKVFEEIKRLNKEGTKLNEISINLLSEDYKDTLIQVSEEESIEISLRKEKPLIELPLIKEFLSIIETKINNSNKSSIINRVKSNYFAISDYGLRSQLEIILRRLDFNSIEKLLENLKREQSLNMPEEYIEDFHNIILKINEELNLIPEKDSILNYNNIILNIIDKYKLPDKIYNTYSHVKDYDLLYRDLSSLEKLKEIINSIKEISLIVEEISIEDYFESIVKLCKNEFILEKDENIKGIKVLSPINARGFSHEYVFIVGMSQQYYPVLKESNFFINDDNHLNLKNIGLDLKKYNERLNNEQIKFASLIASCNKRLYLSLSEGLEGENIPSIFLDEILNLFNGEKLEEKIPTINVDLSYLIKDNIEDITTFKELSNYLIRNHYDDLSLKSKEYFGIHNRIDKEKIKRINEKIICELKRSEKGFNEYSGLIADEKIIEDLREEHKDKVYSNSYLESYSKCPYYFLLNNHLKVEETELNFKEYSPIDVGNIYHEVLRHYYIFYKEEISKSVESGQAFLIEDTLENLRELVEKYSIEFNINLKNKSGLLIMENTYDRLKEFIELDINRLSNAKEKSIPYSFEVEFGRTEDFAIDIDGEKIKLRGIIDRIDKIVDSNKFLIMDYKSSGYGADDMDKMEKGLSLQLPIYAMSQKDKNIVAGIYGIISKSEIQPKIGILDETQIISKRHKGAVDQEGWNKLMETTKKNIKSIKDKIISGDFSVNPLECSEYCIYKDICRYEQVLEVE